MKKLIKILAAALFILFIIISPASTCDHGGFGDHGNSQGGGGGSQGNSDSDNGSSDIGGNSTQGISPPSSSSPSSSASNSPGIGISNIGISSSASSNADLSSADISGDTPNHPAMIDIILAKNDCWHVINGWCVNVIEPGIWRAEKNGKVVIYHKVIKK